ncbi:MAG: anti-sigma factor, partial [Gammaproteobacteria bacterium]|nr:anti-sigma factor [Gammaproteobacteria bacterium]
WWKIVGDETMIALVVVMGEVAFLGPGGEVRARASAASQRDAYEAYCREHGLVIHELSDR